jgi:DinB superfamily/SCP-2 sterol transfer family
VANEGRPANLDARDNARREEIVMSTNGSTVERDALLADLKHLWTCCDELFDGMSAKDWTRRHGPDWTFADLPYHLAYFDRDLIANPIARGEDVPAAERVQYRSLADLARYNAGKFAERPTGQTVAKSIEQMRASRDHLSRIIDEFSDADLDGRCWAPLFGWVTRGQVIHALIAHNWSHLMEARARLKRNEPVPSPSVTRRGLCFYTGILAGTFVPERAGDARLTVAFSFTGPAASAWTLYVAGGAVTVTPGHADRPDLVLEMSPDTFVRMLAQINNPMVLMLTRKIKVRGFRRMGAFGKFFPTPQPDRVLNLALAPAVASV